MATIQDIDNFDRSVQQQLAKDCEPEDIKEFMGNASSAGKAYRECLLKAKFAVSGGEAFQFAQNFNPQTADAGIAELYANELARIIANPSEEIKSIEELYETKQAETRAKNPPPEHRYFMLVDDVRLSMIEALSQTEQQFAESEFGQWFDKFHEKYKNQAERRVNPGLDVVDNVSAQDQAVMNGKDYAWYNTYVEAMKSAAEWRGNGELRNYIDSGQIRNFTDWLVQSTEQSITSGQQH